MSTLAASDDVSKSQIQIGSLVQESQEIQNGPMWIDRKVDLDGDHGAMGFNHNEVLSHGLSRSRNVGSEEGRAEQGVPLEYGGSSGQPQERQPRLEVAKTAGQRHVNEARKPVKQEGGT